MYDTSHASALLLAQSYGLRPAGSTVQPVRASSPVVDAVWGAVSIASVGASAYHGARRNDSVGWGIWWGLMGGIFPILTPAIAIAQGFGDRKRP